MKSTFLPEPPECFLDKNFRRVNNADAAVYRESRYQLFSTVEELLAEIEEADEQRYKNKEEIWGDLAGKPFVESCGFSFTSNGTNWEHRSEDGSFSITIRKNVFTRDTNEILTALRAVYDDVSPVLPLTVIIGDLKDHHNALAMMKPEEGELSLDANRSGGLTACGAIRRLVPGDEEYYFKHLILHEFGHAFERSDNVAKCVAAVKADLIQLAEGGADSDGVIALDKMASGAQTAQLATRLKVWKAAVVQEPNSIEAQSEDLASEFWAEIFAERRLGAENANLSAAPVSVRAMDLFIRDTLPSLKAGPRRASVARNLATLPTVTLPTADRARVEYAQDWFQPSRQR